MKFVRGQSGNPLGKPKGARNKVTLAVEDLLAGQAEKLTEAAIERALSGDPAALRLCLDRIAPLRKGRPVQVDIPAVNSVADTAAAMGAVTNAMAAGDLTPDEAASVAAVIEIRRRALETMDLERRVAELEHRRERTKG